MTTRELLSELCGALDAGAERVLCQVVETRGSTPQKAGALMLVDDRGGQAGTLGGGCVEHEVRQRAIRRFGSPGAELHDFLLDHDYAWADGLICGGRMRVVVERLAGAEALAYWSRLRELIEAGRGFTEAVVVDPAEAGLPAEAMGARAAFGPDGELAAVWRLDPGFAAADLPARGLLPLDARPRPRRAGGVAWTPAPPRARVLIVGAGHVGQGVAELAAKVDFDVWVVDDRRQYANPERFPDASRILVGPIERVLEDLKPEIDPHTFALIVTRGHGHDQEALFHLAPTTAGYVGLIGSKRKIRMIKENLLEQGIPPRALARVVAPVGFAIGSQSVPEIAVSIVAQLIQWRNLGPDPAIASETASDPAPELDLEPANPRAEATA